VTTHELRVRASTYGKEPTELAATANEFGPRDRMKRGLRAFLPFFGAGCALLLIPPHVVWLLLWTTVGIVQGRKRYRQPRELVSLSGTCPGCGASGDLPKPDSLPAIQRCAQCGAFLKLEAVAEAS
jgi:hypothetical protein